MSHIVVKYHNDFNKIQLPSFTEQEQNILFTILSKIKDKKQENNKPIRLFAKDIIMGKVESKEHFTAIMNSLKNKFFKADFRQIHETDTEIIESHIHFFNTMDIHYQKKNPNDGNDNSKIFCFIDLAVNERFEYLLNELTANFTRFELVEFVSLSGKYTKTLYRNLKQYRYTGKLKMQWQEFMRVMDIPYTRQSDIDQFILKPAIKELTKPRTLFDQQRIPFKNLTYNKQKERGNKITSIEFTFTPESEAPELKLETTPHQELLGKYKQYEGANYEIKNLRGERLRFMYIKKLDILDNGKIRIIVNEPQGEGKKAINEGQQTLTEQEFQSRIIANLYNP